MSDFISLVLPEVMGDIGVTEKMVKRRRKAFMIIEKLATCIHGDLAGEQVISYNIGSQTEGSTTIMLKSDIDRLFEYHNLNLVQEQSEHNADNALLIQDERTAPGHCFLQVKSKNIYLKYPDKKFHRRRFFNDKNGRLLLKNTCYNDFLVVYDERNGPAHTLQKSPGQMEEDNVIAWHCKYWPREAQQWLVKDGKRVWPSENLRRECEKTGCTIVPISSKGSQFAELEWRISTCLAERHLMFSLNITQIRCYVLLKMIRKTFIEPKYPDTISSYICKTVLFHCIYNEISLNWHGNQLMGCLNSCIRLLEEFVKVENCPHFIIPGNNLLKGKITREMKNNLLILLRGLKTNLDCYLLMIDIDQLRTRIMKKAIHFMVPYPVEDREYIHSFISMSLMWHIATHVSVLFMDYLKMVNSTSCKEKMVFFTYDIAKLTSLYKMYDKTESALEKSAYRLLIPFVRSSFASTMASYCIGNSISIFIFPDVIINFVDSLNSDVSSSKLKLASALYSSGELDKTENVIHALQDTYDVRIVENVCKCYNRETYLREGFKNRKYTGNEELVREIFSFCVLFLPCEVNCIPRELQYEMYRSTTIDKLQRHENDHWMDWAVVDSPPYIYFLLYKTYSQLQEKEKQTTALTDLIDTIKSEPNLAHKETALNLLGQCMEQEHRGEEALECYVQSLNLRPRNNAARIHICIMISTLINKKYGTEQQRKCKEKKRRNKNFRKRNRKNKLR